MIERGAQAKAAAPAPPDPALIEAPRGAITFFYYDDLPAAAAFYREVVGLPAAFDADWCVIFELGAGGARLGLVNAVAGSQRPVAGPNKGTILSLEVDSVEACLDRLKRLGAAPPGARLQDGFAGRTREFKLKDPGGYTVEFFSWSSGAGLWSPILA